MADSLKTLLMDKISDLQDGIVSHLDAHSAREVLGEDLDQLRSTGTGKSLVMLALLDDLLRMTEIVLAGQWNPLEPNFARFAAPFLQTAARTFAKKGLKQYAPFANLSPESAGKFLEFHADSGRPFGGHHGPTQWSGLTICANVADQYGDLATLDGYEDLAKTLLTALSRQIPHAKREDLRQLQHFIADRCGDVRDRLVAAQQDRRGGHVLAKERAELEALWTELAGLKTQLEERERLIQHEWKRFRQERAEFEQLRQEWEERLAEQPASSEERERLANERETLAIERAALNHQRQRLEAARTEWEASRQMPTSDLTRKLQAEEARILAERRKLDEERAALWHEREELAALREQLLAGDNRAAEEDHILLAGDSFKQKVDENAAVVTVRDANELLISAAREGDLAQLQAALNWGADVDHSAADFGWQTPMHLAARDGHVEIVRALLEAGADAQRTDAESLNPLESAIINEQPAAARFLAVRAPETITQAYPVLVRIVRDTKSPVVSRQLCVEAIGYLKARAVDSIPTLLNLLESESRELGHAAAEALAKIDRQSLDRQAIPYLTHILEGPMVKNEAADSEWIANLHAARGDLYRLMDRPAQAIQDYESALNFASAVQRPALQDLLDSLESQASGSSI